jgi:hypothetical protein
MVARTSDKLTPKQEAFAAALATGVSQAEAYRTAFPSSLKWADSTVWPKASTLAANGKVQARLAELQAEAAAKAVYTLADHLKRLDDLSRDAQKNGEFTAAVKAEEIRGKAAGFHPTKVELTGKGGGPIESKQTRDLTDEELAAELARNGIKP